MTSSYLTREEKVSRVARELRRLKRLEDASAISVALQAAFPLVDVRALMHDAVAVERARRALYATHKG